MDFDEYQLGATKTMQYGEDNAVVYPALGLAGEAGEVANKVKKIIRDDDGILTEAIRQQIAGELGDVLWYLAALATDINVPLNDIAKRNLEKLQDRQRRGVITGSGDNR